MFYSLFAVMFDGDDVVKLGAEALDLINKAIYFDTSGGNIIAACDYYDLAILNIDEGSDACIIHIIIYP